jgi:hypothetical protein
MNLSDRIKRWWSPAEWRDEHPEESEGEGFALSEEEQRAQGIQNPSLLDPPGGDQRSPIEPPRD